ncbi:hypothetical protein VHEMI06263 [[Torrubiella] hemipterigena]|uniref:Autophagy-related protein 33 n=1 Tax=[Torrubiella] hemipterigena TaxID=1531966 RepID=A0A0A1T041_9HYPO|nr:hypothetical protein VHEMI06263 [[Torrubiella] hemipterigena]
MLICKAAPALKFVGTVSLGLLTGLSYTVSSLTLPSLLHLPSSSSASLALTALNASLQTPIRVLTSLAAIPFLFSFAFSPRRLRHPYLLYTSVLAILSGVAPALLPKPAAATPRSVPAKKPVARARMESSYEVLGDVHSETASEEEIDDLHGDEVRTQLESLATSFVVRGGLSAVAFVLAVVGIWGDGAPRVVVA